MSKVSRKVDFGLVDEVFRRWCPLVGLPVAEWDAALVAAGHLPMSGSLSMYCKSIAPHLSWTWNGYIYKSNYLARRLFVGETHRTVPCPNPQHAEHWHGLPGECACDGTGWLRAETTASTEGGSDV